jgi:hypothetical protein
VIWEIAAATLTAIGSIIGSAWAIRWVIRHEREACDARLDAFREGLDRR